MDIAASLALLVISSPMLAVLWALVRATSPGPALFRQERVGRHGRPFVMLKLRTMYVGNDDRIHREFVTNMLSGGQEPARDAPAAPAAPAARTRRPFKLDADPRVTPVGALLRRASLDELPQLLNVLRGDMSLVGPRPMLPWEAELLEEPYRPRFAVKPGITGLWQVSGRSWLSMRKALELDVEYVLRRSLALDFLILLRTVPAVFKGGAR